MVAADVSHKYGQSANRLRGSIRHVASQYEEGMNQYRNNPFASKNYRGNFQYQNRPKIILTPARNDQPPYEYPPPSNGYLPQVRFTF